MPLAVHRISATGPNGQNHVIARTVPDMNARMGASATTVSGTASRLEDICSRAERPATSPANRSGWTPTAESPSSSAALAGARPSSRHETICVASVTSTAESHLETAISPAVTPASTRVT